MARSRATILHQSFLTVLRVLRAPPRLCVKLFLPKRRRARGLPRARWRERGHGPVGHRGAEPMERGRVGSGLVGLLLGDQAADPLGEQGAVERLLEGVVEAEAVRLVAGLVAG